MARGTVTSSAASSHMLGTELGALLPAPLPLASSATAEPSPSLSALAGASPSATPSASAAPGSGWDAWAASAAELSSSAALKPALPSPADVPGPEPGCPALASLDTSAPGTPPVSEASSAAPGTEAPLSPSPGASAPTNALSPADCVPSPGSLSCVGLPLSAMRSSSTPCGLRPALEPPPTDAARPPSPAPWAERTDSPWAPGSALEAPSRLAGAGGRSLCARSGPVARVRAKCSDQSGHCSHREAQTRRGPAVGDGPTHRGCRGGAGDQDGAANS